MEKTFKITVDGRPYTVTVEEVGSSGEGSMYGDTGAVASSVAPAPAAPAPAPAAAPAPAPAAGGAGDKVAPLGGVIVEISVKVGEAVTAGQQVAIIEAMKMKTVIASDHDGTVSNIAVNVGDAVDAGQVLMTIS